MQRISNPTPIFLDARGTLLDNGSIYVGIADGDPETDPIAVFWDEALTQAAPQPLKTLGGVIVNGTQPAAAFIAEGDFSMRVRDANGALVNYSPSVYVDTDAFQPKDSDLTAIAALSTTPFGRALLTLADQAALKDATGYPDPLPKAGGSVTGEIIRQGNGSYLFWNSSNFVGRVTPTPVGAPDPTTGPGEIWITYS